MPVISEATALKIIKRSNEETQKVWMKFHMEYQQEREKVRYHHRRWQAHRWVNPQNQRYYSADLEQDLFGEWVLNCRWGSLRSQRGGVKITAVQSWEEGRAMIDALAKRRCKRGYQIAASNG